MFSDLESDYINPIDFCNKLNQVILFPFILRPFAKPFLLAVCHPRIRCTRISRLAFPSDRAVDCYALEFTPAGMERE